RRRRAGARWASASPRALRRLCAPARGSRRALGHHGRGFDLDQQVVAHEARDLDEGARRPVRAEVLLADGVDLLAVGHVLEEHRHLADVGEGGAGGDEAALDVLVDLTGLRDDVAAADRLAVLVAGDAAGDEHDRPRAHEVGDVADRLRPAWAAALLPLRRSPVIFPYCA